MKFEIDIESSKFFKIYFYTVGDYGGDRAEEKNAFASYSTHGYSIALHPLIAWL